METYGKILVNIFSTNFAGSQKGGFPKGWFWRMFPRNEKIGTSVRSDVPPERKPERGYVRLFPRNETGTRAHSPKPPFYETALLSPLTNKKDSELLLTFPVNATFSAALLESTKTPPTQGISTKSQTSSLICKEKVASGVQTLTV